MFSKQLGTTANKHVLAKKITGHMIWWSRSFRLLHRTILVSANKQEGSNTYNTNDHTWMEDTQNYGQIQPNNGSKFQDYQEQEAAN
jgi:hypothetical protein